MRMETRGWGKRKGFLCAVVVLICAFVLVCNVALAADSKVYRWRAVSHQMPGTARYEKTVVPFCKMVEEASGGRLVIEPFGGGILFPVFDTFEAVRNGTVEMAMIWNGYWAGINPVFALGGNLPGDPIAEFGEHYYRIEKISPVLAKAYAKYGIKDLGGFDYNPREIFLSSKPIKTLEEFKGLNVRAGGISAEYYNKLGASVVSLSAPELYTALQTSTIDALEYNDWLVNMEMGLHEVTKFVIEPCLHQGVADDKQLIVNPAAWKGLPDDLKAIVLQCRDVARYLSAVAYGVGNKTAKNEWLKAGTKIITLPDEEVEKARKVAVDLLLEYKGKNPECAEFINAYADALSDLGYTEMAQLLKQ